MRLFRSSEKEKAQTNQHFNAVKLTIECGRANGSHLFIFFLFVQVDSLRLCVVGGVTVVAIVCVIACLLQLLSFQYCLFVCSCNISCSFFLLPIINAISFIYIK